jgi:Uma2 family endonuclease
MLRIAERIGPALLGATVALGLFYAATSALEAVNPVNPKGGGLACFCVGFVPALVAGATFGWVFARRPKRMTADEFWEWWHLPGNGDRLLELVRGKVVERPLPGERHGVACAWLAQLLWQYALRPGVRATCAGRTAILVEERPDTVLAPDLLLWAEVRTLAEMSTKYLTSAPPLVVEVLAPGDQIADTRWRVGRYLARGTRLVWVVDPEERSVSVHQTGRPARLVRGAEELTGEDVFPGLHLRAAELFALPSAAEATR